MIYRFNIVLLAFAVLAMPALAQTIILDQPPNQFGIFVSDADCNFCGGGGTSIADNFVFSLGIGQDVAFIEWIGVWWPAPTGNPVAVFDINFYLDAPGGGIPDAPIGPVCSLSGVTPVSTPTGVTILGVPEILYQLDVNVGDCNLADQVVYWIEIFNITVEDTDWWWECGDLDNTNGIPGSAFALEAPGQNWGVSGLDNAVSITSDDEMPTDVEVAVERPDTHVLSGAYPNPFNPLANFTLEVAEQQSVRIAVYDALGREVAMLFNGTLGAGPAHEFTIDGAGLPSGIYVVRATGEQFTDALSVTLLK